MTIAFYMIYLYKKKIFHLLGYFYILYKQGNISLCFMGAGAKPQNVGAILYQ